MRHKRDGVEIKIMSAQVFPAVIEVEQESQAQEALIDLGFEFDWQAPMSDWDKFDRAFHELPRELSGIHLILDGGVKPLVFPEYDLQLCVSDSYTQEYLKGCPDSLNALFKKFPELKYFLTQFSGLPICDASVHGLQNLNDDASFISSQSGVTRKVRITEEEAELEIRVSSGRRHSNYTSGEEGDLTKPRFFLESDETTLRIPIDSKTGALTGQAKLSSVLLLQRPEGRAISDFQGDVSLIQSAKEYGVLNHYLRNTAGLKKTQAEAIFLTPPSPPKKISLLATPIFSGSLFAGAALVATLVFAVAPPLGLGLVASALIMAGIGVLIGAGINALRVRKSSQATKKYTHAVSEKNRMAMLFHESSFELDPEMFLDIPQ